MEVKSNLLIWFLLFLAGVIVHAPAWAGKKQPSEDKVAVVNGVVITRADLDGEMHLLRQRLLRRGMRLNESRVTDMKKEALENLIDRQLLYQESQIKGIQIDDAIINEKMRTLKEQFAGEAEFKEALSKMNLSEASMKSDFKERMAIQRFVDKEIAQKVTVSDKEVRAYYDKNPDFFKQPEQVSASHILIKIDPKAKESQKAEARKKLEKIGEKVKGGGDFSALAKEFSECPSSAEGGDLGYFARGQMVKPFEEAAFALKPGEVSGIVETNFGYHLIKVVDKKAETMIAYENIRGRLQEYIKQDKVRKHVDLHVQDLKKKASIKRFLPEGSN